MSYEREGVFSRDEFMERTKYERLDALRHEAMSFLALLGRARHRACFMRLVVFFFWAIYRTGVSGPSVIS